MTNTPQDLSIAEHVDRLLKRLETLPDDVGPAEVQPSYLRRLALEAKQKTDLPSDKICRWIGFCYGAVMHDNLWDESTFKFAPPTTRQDNSAHPVTKASIEVLEGLKIIIQHRETYVAIDENGPTINEDMVFTSSSKAIVTTLEEADTLSIAELSLRVGVIQGYLTYHQYIDVNGERDRTRPIFHKAYREINVIPPASVSINTKEGSQ